MLQLKKSLGQHFLQDEMVCQKIIDAIIQHSFSQLLEVGSGGGALTKYLLQIKNVNLKVVELDEEKVNYLIKIYPSIQHKIIHNNFLEISPPFENLFYLVGNFPYNISSQIIFKAIEWKKQIQGLTGMFQKEVAQRIAAVPGNKLYGVISVLVQAFFNVTYLFDVPPIAFNPPPKVMSGVIQLLPNLQVPEMFSEKTFFLLVKTAFNQRRKTLRNAVRHLFSLHHLQDPIFNLRAEQLSVQEFAMLTFKMNESNLL